MAKFLDTAGLTYLWGKIKTALSGKVDKVSGKGLSTNDYTTAEKNKLTGIETGANKYVHPSYTAKTNGLYKVTVDAAGHVSGTTPVTKTDITGLGIPASNTTYSDFEGATANAAGTHGLVPAPAKGDTGKLLSGKGTWEAMTMAYTEEDYTQASVGLTFAGSTVKANIPVATTGNMGLMPPAMFSKLNDLPTEADLSGIYAKKSDITGVYKYKGSLADATKLPTTGQVAGDVYNLEAASDYGPAGTNVAWDGKAWDALGGGTPTTITGNAGTATKLQTTRAIDGVNFNGTADIAHYAVCYTTGSTAAKTVSLSNFKLAAGARVFVRFSYANTAGNPTLNVNSTGAKAIQYRNSAIPANLIKQYAVLELVYSGSYWYVVGDIDAAVLLSTTAVTPSSITTWTYSAAISALANYDEIRVWLEVSDGKKGWVTLTRNNPAETVIAMYLSSAYNARVQLKWDTTNNKVGVYVRNIGSGWTVNQVSIKRIEGLKLK